MKNAIADYFNQLLAPPTLQEIITQKMQEEAQVIINTEHVIRTHQFQKHMANATISALEEWNRQNRIFENGNGRI